MSSGDYTYIGCFADNSNPNSSRAIPNYIGKVTSPDQCAQLTINKGDTVFGIQNNGECRSGIDLTSAKKYGSRNNCSTLGGPFINQVYTINPVQPTTFGNYNYKGCYNDKSDKSNNRAIPNNRGQVTSTQQCGNIADQNNETLFGVQNGGICFTGTSLPNAMQYGAQSSYCGLLGSFNTNQVFAKDYTSPSYIMNANELQCYKNNYPQDLSTLSNAALQTHWATIGALQGRNNQCPSQEIFSGLYNYKGCYNNTSISAVPTLQGNVTSIDACEKLAESTQSNVFAVQNNGQCYTGKNEQEAYQYGSNFSKNSCPSLGGTNTIQVYVKGLPFPKPSPPIPNLTTSNFSTNESFKNILEEEMNDNLVKNIFSGIIIIIIILLLFIFIYRMTRK